MNELIENTICEQCGAENSLHDVRGDHYACSHCDWMGLSVPNTFYCFMCGKLELEEHSKIESCQKICSECSELGFDFDCYLK